MTPAPDNLLPLSEGELEILNVRADYGSMSDLDGPSYVPIHRDDLRRLIAEVERRREKERG